MDITEIGDLTSLLLGFARVLIMVAGGAIGIVKVVKGRSDENPREFQEGFIIIASAAVIVAATFGIEKIFS